MQRVCSHFQACIIIKTSREAVTMIIRVKDDNGTFFRLVDYTSNNYPQQITDLEEEAFMTFLTLYCWIMISNYLLDYMVGYRYSWNVWIICRYRDAEWKTILCMRNWPNGWVVRGIETFLKKPRICQIGVVTGKHCSFHLSLLMVNLSWIWAKCREKGWDHIYALY